MQDVHVKTQRFLSQYKGNSVTPTVYAVDPFSEFTWMGIIVLHIDQTLLFDCFASVVARGSSGLIKKQSVAAIAKARPGLNKVIRSRNGLVRCGGVWMQIAQSESHKT